MLRIRRFEEKCAELYSAGKIRGFLHLYIGEEAVAVGAMQALDAGRRGRRDLPRARPRAGARHPAGSRSWRRCTANTRAAAAAAADRCTSSTRDTRFYGGNAIVGGGLPIAVGLALADKMQQRPRVTACFFGDGAVAEGEFHESLNLAALWKLPVLFLCENNLYAMGTRLERAQSQTDLAREGAELRDAGRGGGRHGRARRRGGDADAPPTPSGAATGPRFSSSAPTASARTRCSTPSCIATSPRSRVEAARSDRDVHRAPQGARTWRPTRSWPRSRRPCPTRSTRPCALPKPARGSRSRIC